MNEASRHTQLVSLLGGKPVLMLDPSARVDTSEQDGFSSLYDQFEPISLARTNELAAMQSRVDNKYYVDFPMLEDFLETMKSEFSVMEIKGRRQFSYHSIYYDDEYKCYYEHHQGRRQRFKVRTREYVDGGGMTFFEIKLKGRRGITVKHRMASDFVLTNRIEGEYLDMLEGIYSDQYHKAMPLTLKPSLIIDYKRCTLVARAGGERVTLDYQLSFADPNGTAPPVRIGKDFVIIETKSADGKGMADTCLKKLKIRKASNCSKYCIGVNLIGAVEKNNNFRHTVRHVERNIIANSPGRPQMDNIRRARP